MLEAKYGDYLLAEKQVSNSVLKHFRNYLSLGRLGKILNDLQSNSKVSMPTY